MHIILDTNIYGWNIKGKQLDFLKKNFNNKQVNNIFIYVHHVIWYTEKEYNIPIPNSKSNMQKPLNFWNEIFPLLKETNKNVFVFAGDVGAFERKNMRFQSSYSYLQKDNVHLITSGMGGGKNDNLIVVDVLKNKDVKFRLIHLNGDNINGLGDLVSSKDSVK